MRQGSLNRARKLPGGRLIAATIMTSSLATATTFAPDAFAQSIRQTTFTIPAGPLNQALAAFGRQSNLQVTYLPSLAAGRTSRGFSGTATPAQAMARLLDGTGLTSSFPNATTVAVSAPSANAAGAGETYLGTLQVVGADDGTVGFVATRTQAASKTDTPLTEIPQSVSVVTADQMEQQDAQSLKQALRYTAGVAADSRPGLTGYDIIYSRGFALNRYLDGTRLTGGENALVTPQIEPYGMERLDVLRGPAGALYGSSSPGGLVDAISKRPTADPIHEIQVQTGNFDRIQGAFDLGGPVTADGTLLYRVVGLAKSVDSQVDYNHQERYYLAPSLTWRPNADTSLTVLASIQYDPYLGLYNFIPALGSLYPNPNGRIPRNTFLGQPSYNENSRTQESIGYAFEHRFNDVWQFRQNARFMSTDGTVKQVLPLPPASGGVLSFDKINRYAQSDQVSINSFNIDNVAQADFSTGPLVHKLLLGLDYQRVSESEILGQGIDTFPNPYPISIFFPKYNQVILPTGPVQNTTQVQGQLGLYAQDQIKLDRFVVTLSGREDWVNSETTNNFNGTVTKQDPSAFTWRAGVNYLFDNGISPYVSYATSFEPQLGTNQATQQPFVPTTGQQYEAGIKYQPPGINMLITAAVFDLTKQNVVTVDPANPLLSVQTGEIESKGIELEAKASLSQGWDILAAYTYLDAKVTQSLDASQIGKRPLNVPDQMASLWLFYTVQEGPLLGLGLGGGVRYVGDSAGSADNAIIVPAYTLFDAALQYDFAKQIPAMKGVKLTLNATNLFDKTYVSECTNIVNCLYGTGRTVVAGLKYNW